MTTSTETPQIYVACLAAYNNGFLHGTWIDCDQDAENIQAEVNEMLKTSPAWEIGDICEEWAIHDYQYFGDISISEAESFETVAAIASAVEEYGKAFLAYYSIWGELDADDFEDRYQGEHTNQHDFVYGQLEDWGTLKTWTDAGMQECYIDFDAIARDWFINDYCSERSPEGNIFVFSNH